MIGPATVQLSFRSSKSKNARSDHRKKNREFDQRIKEFAEYRMREEERRAREIAASAVGYMGLEEDKPL